MKTIKNLEKIANSIRKQVLKMSYDGNGAHISSSLCIVDALTYLYWKEMTIRPNDPDWKKRDKFILSKGHSAPTLYAILTHRGFFPKKLLKSYRKDDSKMGVHPEFDSFPGIELSAGSLGHGLSVGTGMALAEKINNSKRKIFVLISDAECNEGKVWEAVLFAAQHKLNNLFLLIDYNKFQAYGKTKDVLDLKSLRKKLSSFGWSAFDVNGNNLTKIDELFRKIKKLKINKPTAIVLHTVAGKGVSFIEDKLEWHYRNLDDKLYKQAIAELNK